MAQPPNTLSPTLITITENMNYTDNAKVYMPGRWGGMKGAALFFSGKRKKIRQSQQPEMKKKLISHAFTMHCD